MPNPTAVKLDPVVGGATIGLQVDDAVVDTGTACIVLNRGEAQFLLTCYHVLFRLAKSTADETEDKLDEKSISVVQPDVAGEIIGTRGKSDLILDAALVDLTKRAGSPRTIFSDAGNVTLTKFWKGNLGILPRDFLVQKYGARTGGTKGVVDIDKFHDKEFDLVGKLEGLVQITGKDGVFAVAGDSGAPVFADIRGESNLLGMVVGIEAPGSPIAYAMPIHRILTSLGVSF